MAVEMVTLGDEANPLREPEEPPWAQLIALPPHSALGRRELKREKIVFGRDPSATVMQDPSVEALIIDDERIRRAATAAMRARGAARSRASPHVLAARSTARCGAILRAARCGCRTRA